MAIRLRENWIGAWAFSLGVILATIIGLTTTLIPVPTLVKYSVQIYGILVLLGLLIGFLNVPNKKDTQTFLLAGTVLVIVSKFGMESVTGSLIGIGIGAAIASIFSALLALFVPATIIVALKSLFSISNA